MYDVPYMLHVFLITCYNYQYKFSSLCFLHIIPFSQNWMTPTFIWSYWWSFPVLHTRVGSLKWRIFYRIHRWRVPVLDEFCFYVYVTKPLCTKPTYIISGTTYNKHAYKVMEYGWKPAPVLAYQFSQNSISHQCNEED